MKSKLFRLLSVMLVGAGALVLQPAQAAKVRVVTTLTDLADLTREIGGQYVDVSSLATGVEDTHGVPMKPSFVPMMNRADLLINVGFGCEHAFLPALLEASKNPRIQYGKAGYVDCSGGVMPLAFLTVLRDAVPQFAERSRTGNGYAQQGFPPTSFGHPQS